MRSLLSILNLGPSLSYIGDFVTFLKILETVMLDGLSAVLQLSMQDAYKDLW